MIHVLVMKTISMIWLAIKLIVILLRWITWWLYSFHCVDANVVAIVMPTIVENLSGYCDGE